MSDEQYENLFKNVVVNGHYPLKKLNEMRSYIKTLNIKNEVLQQENEQLKQEIRKYQKDRDINTKRHLEVQDYIKSRIQYCEELTGFDCCIEELEEISKMV